MALTLVGVWQHFFQSAAATITVPPSVLASVLGALAGGVTSYIAHRVATDYRIKALEKESRDVQKGLATELSRLSNRIDALVEDREEDRRLVTDVRLFLAELRGAQHEAEKRKP